MDPAEFAMSLHQPLLDEPSPEDQDDEWDFLLGGSMRTTPMPARACGNCREFVEDKDGGRGTCLHPGSGILSPWTDTPGCDFHQGRRNW